MENDPMEVLKHLKERQLSAIIVKEAILDHLSDIPKGGIETSFERVLSFLNSKSDGEWILNDLSEKALSIAVAEEVLTLNGESDNDIVKILEENLINRSSLREGLVCGFNEVLSMNSDDRDLLFGNLMLENSENTAIRLEMDCD